jgi:hypothetical protein
MYDKESYNAHGRGSTAKAVPPLGSPLVDRLKVAQDRDTREEEL